MNVKRVAALAYKEWREIVRDRLYFGLAFVVPPVMLLVIGFGVNLDVENLSVYIIDYDRSPLSREYTHKFIGLRYLTFKGYLSHERDIGPLLSERYSTMRLSRKGNR